MKPSSKLPADLVPVVYAVALLDLTEEHGVTRGKLLVEAHMRPEMLGNPQERLSILNFTKLTNSALRLCDEPAMSLLLGQRLNVSAHYILGYGCCPALTLARLSSSP